MPDIGFKLLETAVEEPLEPCLRPDFNSPPASLPPICKSIPNKANLSSKGSATLVFHQLFIALPPSITQLAGFNQYVIVSTNDFSFSSIIALVFSSKPIAFNIKLELLFDDSVVSPKGLLNHS